MTVEILSSESNHASFLIWLDGNNYPVLASIGCQSTKIFMGYLEVKRISNTEFELTNTPWSYGFVMSAYPMIVKSI